MAGLKFVISVTALLVSDTSAGYVYSKKQANWKTAKHSCESGDGILLGQTPILDDFVNKLPVWLDGVVTWLPWMANAGCYRYVERYIEIRSFYTLRENSPLSCLGKCNHRLPIGLLNATCYCLTTFPKLKKVSGSFCQTPCSGNTNEMCGGSGKLGFHEYITIHNGGIDETRKMDVGNNSCLTVEVSGKVYKYRDRKCTAMYPVLCQDSRRNFIERMERKQWQDASIECKTYNLELADIQTIEMNVFMKNEEFWTGYFRKSNAVWNTDWDVQNKAGCYVLDKTGYKIENCSKTYNFICYKEDIFKDTTVFSTARTSSIQAVTIPLAHTKNEETVNCAVLVGIVVACLIVFNVIVVTIVIIIYRRRSKQKRGINNSTNIQQLDGTYNKVEENEELLYRERDIIERQQSNDGISENTHLVQPTQENIANESYDGILENTDFLQPAENIADKIHNDISENTDFLQPTENIADETYDVISENTVTVQPKENIADETYDGTSENTDIVQSKENVADETFDHLQLNGQRVSFNVDGRNNFYDTSGSNSYRFSDLNTSQNEHYISVL